MKYLYKKILQYLSVYIGPGQSVLEIDGENTYLDTQGSWKYYKCGLETGTSLDQHNENSIEYIVINGSIHYWDDIQGKLTLLYNFCNPDTRVIIVYYSSLWKPFVKLSDLLGIRKKRKEMNWLAPIDIQSFSHLSNFEIVQDQSKILLPVYIPFLSDFVNRFIANLPIISGFCLIRMAIIKPVQISFSNNPSVSVVIPARNESGNIADALQRIPLMGERDEVIFVEGNSTDDTWHKINELCQLPLFQKKWNGRINFIQQEGKGKGDAVRKGFSLAQNEILMILDADLTVPPEELPKFYAAIKENKGEFINGSRLVYPMEKKAMRFFNILGNKFFAISISYVLGTPLKDTLCGTKVISRKNYQKIVKNRSYFGEFDPFGDFDLLFGANRLGLKIIELPIKYRDRLYGDTNISRWKHGLILLRMTFFAAKKIKFI